MQRWTSVVVGLLATAGLIAAVFKAGHPSEPVGPKPPASASASAAIAPIPPPSASATGDGDPLLEPEAPAEWGGDAGASPLPATAPAVVTFGVVLFTYQGVQFAPKDARTKEAARDLAKATVEEARKSFADAVEKGDRGSTTDAGRIPRGVLEPEIEYVLFTLEKGGVASEPVDTPRGYWILRRNE